MNPEPAAVRNALVSCAWMLAAALLFEVAPFGPPVRFAQAFRGPHPGPALVDVSSDGRFIAFESFARLLPLDRNSTQDVYVIDRFSGRLTLESVSVGGSAADGSSCHPRLSGDGRYVVFESVARNLVANWPTPGAPAAPQIFLRDRHTETTALLTLTPQQQVGDAWSTAPDISGDGRRIVFQSAATNLVAGADANGSGTDVYLFDVDADVMTRVSVDRLNRQPSQGVSGTPTLSGDGRYVAFASSARLDDSVPMRVTRSTPLRQVFVRDIQDGTTRLVSRSGSGAAGDGASSYPAISASGRFIAFTSTAADLASQGKRIKPGMQNVFLFDLASGQIDLVSRTPNGSGANGHSRHPAISGSGHHVVFESEASDLSCGQDCRGEAADLNLVSDVYLLDRLAGRIRRLSSSPERSDPWWQSSAGAATDETGTVVAFSSRHPLDVDDLHDDYDVFIRARAEPMSPPPGPVLRRPR